MIKNKKMIGKVFSLNCGSEATIEKYENNLSINIITDTGWKTKCCLDVLNKGSLHDPMSKSYFEIGIRGIGKEKIFSKKNKAYSIWHNIMERCYSEEYIKKNKDYLFCTVSREWLNFQNFAIWFHKNYKTGYHIDKDLKSNGIKCYSENNCVFVPRKINNFFFEPKNKTNNLPLGISYLENGYISFGEYSISKQKAIDNYWNTKYKKMMFILKDFPEFESLMKNYFEYFFNKHYKKV